MNDKQQRIVIELANGLKLVAEQNNDPMFKNEIFIGIMKDDGIWYQDLAVVRNSHTISGTLDVVWKDEEFDVLVYADKDNEDYTNSFTVELYHEHTPVYIYDIAWDNEGGGSDLPTEINHEFDVEDDDELSDIISDWLSDEYGYCHNGFKYRVK